MGAVYEPGAVILDKYRVDRVLGEGGMGVVVAATHLELQEQVALKFLLPEASATPEIVQRFVREAKAAVRLRGEHVARVSDVGKLPGGLPYMVMEYLRGTDLAGLLAQRQRLPPGEAVDYVLQACEALAEAHAAGIVHRDIKPANLFVTTRPDGSPMIKVLDFGISKITTQVDARLTRTQAVMGTPAYMSPEQLGASHNVDGRTDIWAIGVVLYEALTGSRPFTAEIYPALILQIGVDPVPPIDVPLPAGLASVILRCLEKDLGRRYPSILNLASDLAPFSRDRRSADVMVDRIRGMSPGSNLGRAEVTQPGDRATTTLNASAGMLQSPRRTKGYAFGGLGLGLTVAGLVLIFVTRGSGEEPAATPLPPPPNTLPLAAPPAPPSPSSPVATADDAGITAPPLAAEAVEPQALTPAPAKTEASPPKPRKPPRATPDGGSSGEPASGTARTARGSNVTAGPPAPPPRKADAAPPDPPQVEPSQPDDPRAMMRRRR